MNCNKKKTWVSSKNQKVKRVAGILWVIENKLISSATIGVINSNLDLGSYSVIVPSKYTHLPTLR